MTSLRRKVQRAQQLKEITDEEVSQDVMAAIKKAISNFKATPERDAALVTTLMSIVADQCDREGMDQEQFVEFCRATWETRILGDLSEDEPKELN